MLTRFMNLASSRILQGPERFVRGLRGIVVRLSNCRCRESYDCKNQQMWCWIMDILSFHIKLPDLLIYLEAWLIQYRLSIGRSCSLHIIVYLYYLRDKFLSYTPVYGETFVRLLKDKNENVFYFQTFEAWTATSLLQQE